MFDRLWRPGGWMTRSQAYRWMIRALDLDEDDAHIAMMSAGMCRRLIEAVKALLDQRAGKELEDQ